MGGCRTGGRVGSEMTKGEKQSIAGAGKKVLLPGLRMDRSRSDVGGSRERRWEENEREPRVAQCSAVQCKDSPVPVGAQQQQRRESGGLQPRTARPEEDLMFGACAVGV